MVDYDIVIIGGTSAGRYAARFAAQFKATVALVEPPSLPRDSNITLHALSAIAQQLDNANQSAISTLEWRHLVQWAEYVVANSEVETSPAALAAAGVDFILGNGQFHRSPHLSFAVNGRVLSSRSYLIATGSCPAIPDIAGLSTIDYVTTHNIWQRLQVAKPLPNWVIIGSDPMGIQLAHTLSRLGSKVTMITQQSHLLPQADPEAAQLVQATLEAEGVRLLTQTSVLQIWQIQNQKFLQTETEEIVTDEILVTAGQVPNVANLNLTVLGVKFHRQQLLVNQKLQTTNPRIYACGGTLGVYHTNVANYEASIAVKNALFLPVFRVNYHFIPLAVFSDPMFVQVGLTETEAKHRYGKQVIVLRQYFKSLVAAGLSNQTTGICKLVVLPHGKILGATLVGLEASELIQVIALAIRQNLKVGALQQLASIYPTMSEIFEQITIARRQQQLARNLWLLNFLESFFHLRRSVGRGKG